MLTLKQLKSLTTGKVSEAQSQKNAIALVSEFPIASPYHCVPHGPQELEPEDGAVLRPKTMLAPLLI